MLDFEATADVLRCAWDDDAGRYLALLADGTLLAAAADDTGGSDDVAQVTLLRDGLAATSATFYDD